MDKCRKCGANDWAVIDRNGALETWRCKNCGTEELVHVNDPSIFSLDTADLEPVFLVSGRWRSKPSHDAILEAKKIFRSLKDVSIPDLIRRFFEGRDFELGRFTSSELEELDAKFLDLGIDVERTQVFLNE